MNAFVSLYLWKKDSFVFLTSLLQNVSDSNWGNVKSSHSRRGNSQAIKGKANCFREKPSLNSAISVQRRPRHPHAHTIPLPPLPPRGHGLKPGRRGLRGQPWRWQVRGHPRRRLQLQGHAGHAGGEARAGEVPREGDQELEMNSFFFFCG